MPTEYFIINECKIISQCFIFIAFRNINILNHYRLQVEVVLIFEIENIAQFLIVDLSNEFFLLNGILSHQWIL